MQRMSVVLPEPFFPRIATISPGDAQKLISDSTVCLPTYEKQPFSTVRVTAATPLFFA